MAPLSFNETPITFERWLVNNFSSSVMVVVKLFFGDLEKFLNFLSF